MAEHEPSNAVLLAKLEGLNALFIAYQKVNDTKQDQIVIQTTKTNGRVTKLEKSKYMLVGALLLVNVIGVPIFLALILKFFKIA